MILGRGHRLKCIRFRIYLGYFGHVEQTALVQDFFRRAEIAPPDNAAVRYFISKEALKQARCVCLRAFVTHGRGRSPSCPPRIASLPHVSASLERPARRSGPTSLAC